MLPKLRKEGNSGVFNNAKQGTEKSQGLQSMMTDVETQFLTVFSSYFPFFPLFAIGEEASYFYFI